MEQELMKRVSNSNGQTGNQKSHTINFHPLQLKKAKKVLMSHGNNQLKKLGITKLEPDLMPLTELGTTQMALKELKMIE
jgi:hypothetical protein